MNSIQRHRLKKKIRLFFILAYLIGFGLPVSVVLFLVFIMKPMEEPTTLYGILLVLSIITPMFTGLLLGMLGGLRDQKLRAERKRLLNEKSKLYYQRFCNLIRFKQFDEAKYYYNDFIYGQYRVICHGILLGAVFITGADKNWDDKAWERMINM